MAIIIHKTLGGKPKPITVSDVIGRRYPPPEGCMLYSEQHYGACPALGRTILWGTQWGQLDDPVGTSCSCCSWDLGVGDCLVVSPFLENYSAPNYLGVLPTAYGWWYQDSYLVDSASSHMLVSKIKPCMSKYKQSIL